MTRSVGVSTMMILAWLLGGGAGPAEAQQQQPPLPDVSVTAPAVTDPYAAGDPRAPRTVAPTEINPYYGRNRVDESVFPEIPCTASRMSSSTGGKCLAGYRIGDSTSASNPCHIQLDVVTGATATYNFEADVFVFDPYLVGSGGQQLPKGCSVSKQPQYDLARLQDMNQMTRRGSSWRNYINNYVTNGGDISSEYSDGRLNCLAFRRLGPNWRGGVVWSVHASLCRLDGGAVQPADVHALLSSLRIRVYDSVGNLRPPGQGMPDMAAE
jgi:hypothetical protein